MPLGLPVAKVMVTGCDLSGSDEQPKKASATTKKAFRNVSHPNVINGGYLGWRVRQSTLSVWGVRGVDLVQVWWLRVERVLPTAGALAFEGPRSRRG